MRGRKRNDTKYQLQAASSIMSPSQAKFEIVGSRPMNAACRMLCLLLSLAGLGATGARKRSFAGRIADYEFNDLPNALPSAPCSFSCSPCCPALLSIYLPIYLTGGCPSSRHRAAPRVRFSPVKLGIAASAQDTQATANDGCAVATRTTAPASNPRSGSRNSAHSLAGGAAFRPSTAFWQRIRRTPR
jgi:hypothetical protein